MNNPFLPPPPLKQPPRQWLRILDNMIALDLLKTLTAVLSVIVVIIVSRKFISILKLAVNGQIASETLLSFFTLKIIVVSISLLPISTFIAILMVLGRMYRDQEMTAITAAGAGIMSIYRALSWVVLPLFLVSSLLAMQVAPWAEAKMKELIHKDAESADIRGITPGRFTEYSHGDLVVYVAGISAAHQLMGIFVQDRQQGKLAVVTAASGGIEDREDGRYIVLTKGERTQGLPGSVNFTREGFDEYSVRLEKRSSEVRYDQESVQTLLLWKAGQRIDIAELQRRFSIPLGILLLAFLAVPLAKTAPRGGVYGNMLLAALIYFSYENVRKVAQSWVIAGKLALWPGYIGVYLILFVAGLLLILRLYGWRWLASNLKLRRLP